MQSDSCRVSGAGLVRIYFMGVACFGGLGAVGVVAVPCAGMRSIMDKER